ncbi:MAG: hypothetical protein PWQ51_369 [Methanolobus sp.]|jgi:hypothetical protein|nr:hypothetical protein [Methanolobus sp.]
MFSHRIDHFYLSNDYELYLKVDSVILQTNIIVLLHYLRKPTIVAGICRRLVDTIDQKRMLNFKIMVHSK